MNTPKKVVLIDLSAIFWTAWHSSSDQPVSAAKERSLSTIARICGDGSRLVAIACDSKRSWRKERMPTYKANRPEKDLQVIGELDRLKDRLRADGHVLWEVDGFEADDVIATATKLATAAGHSVMIATPDKDLLQLLSNDVYAFRTHRGKDVYAIDVVQEFGVQPSRLGDWLALVGDKADNVPGARGVGPTKATALVNAYASLTALFEAFDEKPGQEAVAKLIGPAAATSLHASLDDVARARIVIGLRDDVPIDFAQIYAEHKIARLTTDEEEEESMDHDDPPEEEASTATPSPTTSPTAAKPDISPPPVPPPVRKETALAVVQAQLVPFERALEPSDMDKARMASKWLYESRLYSRFQTPEAIFAVIIRGRSLGLSMTTALDVFHMIEGKPVPHAHFIIAKAMEHPDCEYFFCSESTATSATWETKNRRNPKLQSLTYTLAQATLAGLVAKGGNWKTRPDDMLCKTAGVKLVRRVYPGAALGLYADVESGDEEEAA